MFTNQEVRRRSPRVNLRAGMRYQVRGSASESSRTICDNISAGGLAFSCNTYIAPQTPLMLEIDVLSRILHPIGRVAWCEPLAHSDRNRMGVEFLEIDPLEKRYLTDFIEMRRVRF
ncbi:MAG: PilZ domain-containing protein [Candidatus Omnitrophota bacterium]